MRCPASLLTICWLAACAGEAPEPEPTACTPSARLGGGGQEFVALGEGDPVVMVHGPQGGWHIECGARFQGLVAPVELHWWITDLQTDTTVSESWLQVQPWAVPGDACAGDFTGMFGFLDVSDLEQGDLDTPPELLDGALLRISLEADDAEGAGVDTHVQVVAQPDPADVQR
jgi:hypothetical protein